MRKLVIALGVIFVLIAIGVLAVPKFVDVNRYRPQIETKLRDVLGRDVSLGQMRLSLFPLAFRVENAVIAEDPAFGKGRPFAEVQTLYVRPEFWPLLHHELQIDSLQLQHPKVELIRDQRGTWNFASLMTGRKEKEQKPVSLDVLKVYDGEVAITDLQQRKPRAVYDHIDLVLRDFAPEKPFYVDARAHMPGAGEQVIVLNGKAGPIQRDGMANTPFDGSLKLNGVSVSGLQRFMKVNALENSDAVLTGSAKVNNSGGVLTSSGKFEAQNARVRGVDIGYPVAVDYDVNSNLNSDTTQIRKANLKLGQTPLAIQGALNARPVPAVVDLNVQSSDVSIAEIARLAAAFGVAFNPKTTVNGILNLNVHAQGPTDKPVMNGHVIARGIRMTGGDLREPVQVDAMELSLTPDAIRSNEFTAMTGRTKVAAQFNLHNYASDAPQIEAKINTGNAEFEELLRIAHAYGISAVEGMKGSGAVTLNVNASGPLKETDRLTYSGTGALRNASVSMPSLSKPLEVRNADLRFTANSALLDNVDFSLGQTNARGNMALRNFAAPQMEFSLAANQMNLAEWEALLKPEGKQVTPVRGRGEPANTSATMVKTGQSQSFLARTSGSGRLTVDKVVYDQLTLNNVQANVTLDHGIVTTRPISAGLYNGQEVGTVVVNARTTPVTYTVGCKLKDVDANQLLSSISPVKQALYGLLSANADAHFTTTGGATGIARTLNGKVSMNLVDGKIANIDLLHALATIGQFERTAKTVEPFTKVIQMTGDFNINNGVARTNNLKATIEPGSIAANGAVDLAQQKLDLHVTVVLSQDYSRTVGGTAIGGFMNTALANSKGELVIPVIITGTFQDPQFAPDLQKVAQMKLENLVPSTADPLGLTSRILGQVLGGQEGSQAPGRPGLGGILGDSTRQKPREGQQPQPEQQQQQQQPQTQPEPQQPVPNLGDILDSITGKKKNKQEQPPQSPQR